MAGGRYDSSLTRVQPFFTALFANDRWGRSWLPELLAATPHGKARLGPLLNAPGLLFNLLAVPTASGLLGCFEQSAAPPRELLDWFIEHPDQLVWPRNIRLSPETARLRRALLMDDPAGSRVKAQERARELAATRSPFSRAWWRFEGVAKLDCVLTTDKLVLTMVGKRTEPIPPATEWYPNRSELVLYLEAAKHIARGRQWATVLLSETLLGDGSDEHLASVLPASTPHLSANERQELRAGYLGNLTWRDACAAVDLPVDSLRHTSDDLGPA